LPVILLLACFLQDIQKRLIFFAAVRTQIQVFTDQRHEILGILLVYFSFHILIDLGKDLIARAALFLYTFQHMQETQNCLVGELFMMSETLLNLLNDGTDVHSLCFDVWRVANLTYARKA
jgi:hypothetical protein